MLSSSPVSNRTTSSPSASSRADSPTSCQTSRPRRSPRCAGKAILDAAGISPVPLPLSDVLTGLQTGLIDTVAGPPVAAVALQWFTRTKFFTDLPIVYSYGGIVVSKKAFAQLSEADRKIVRDVMTRVSALLDKQTRKDNLSAREALAKQGLQFVNLRAKCLQPCWPSSRPTSKRTERVMDSPEATRPPWILRLLRGAEDTILVSILAIMIVLAAVQIFMRNFFDAGIIWGDPLLRVLVLWVGMLGAMAATRDDRQITVDVISRFVSRRWKPRIRVVTDLFTAAVAGLLSWHAARLVLEDRIGGTIAFASVPVWMCELVLPVALALIALRYAVYAGQHIRQSFAPEAQDA